MADKVPSQVLKIALDDASYKNTGTTIDNLTYVNFFFGNNGTGKSTIAKALQTGAGVTYVGDRHFDEYNTLIYNQDFIDDNFHNYHNMPGVFTITKEDKEAREKIDIKHEEQKASKKAYDDALNEKNKRLATKNALEKGFMKDCWDTTSDLREEFELTQDGKKRMKQFSEAVTTATPVEADLAELRRLYNSAYSDTAKAYTEFSSVSDCFALEGLNGSELLGVAVVNTANTPFASFLKKIKATQWVTEGHDHFSEIAEGKCPYCQRDLAPDFEDILKASFDTQYTENMQALSNYLALYKSTANALFQPLQRIPDEVYPQIDIKPYNDKLAAIKTVIQLNIEVINNKIAKPECSFTMDDISTLLKELDDIITGFNKLIRENNAVVAAQPKKKKECCTAVFSHMAFLLKDKISAYNKSITDIDAEISGFDTTMDGESKKLDAIKTELKELNKRTVETDSAKEGINQLLNDTGFQGFHLEEKKGTPHVYQVMRDDDTVATNLSEGEKNFIAFLYFYYLVRGSKNAEGEVRDKIVVIDDPVSSMDSNTLFMVSTLVHEMIEVCRNNADNRNPAYEGNYIKQIFILTHNAYFHREIASAYVSKYEYVSYFIIRKWDNHSSVKYCDAQNPNAPSERMNVNPVKNSYAALWDEYKLELPAVPLISVIRRILEYYFLQLCGYEGSTLRQHILVENKHCFVDETGKEDLEKYHIAQTMLAYINANSISMNDDIHHVDDSLDTSECRKTFEKLFSIMGQDQHYKKMMGQY